MISTGAAVSLVVVFGIITFLLVRARDVRAWEAVCIALFGLYLGQTPVSLTINGFVTWVLSGFSHF
ncbi:hypothetical protein ACKI1I_37010 [Streptomyces turgidiscabies]|jgi:hypothetical protein|uniref:Uncharacterized protein n=1 Tax=Streptomyces turgidiscabies (strain Car8) TaxID=698760 RepID=L7FBH6_STRT8|nr:MULTISPECIES: hypothetical protein [Streptomyces]ELP66426.1 hypothetical protein STRTUCAR8_03926 [Streptomyces turgidiscabies Car8]ELP68406.1 hypothetical protein STRTUCAR8_09755 [Streptomyces turgidiscabies Car8]MDX3453088.1 hypothetical protein [Streptomyces sp. ME02-8801-2C]MDX3497789.1 hypothetical protein [Streptomyces turgidiscabies]MDX3499549.1 hypothetical protein [Streptomyces turgidiscabies]